MPREPKVTLTMLQADAQWLAWMIANTPSIAQQDVAKRYIEEVSHALAECECGEEK